MTTELDLLQQLHAAPDLQAAVRSASGNELAVQRQLRNQYDASLVRAALTLDAARRRAEGLLPEAERLWLTPVALEQATHPLVAAHKAARFPPDAPVLDLCSGIGVDTAALARRGPVTAIDHDPAMLQRLLWNLQIWNDSPPDTQAVSAEDVSLADRFIHADPDRRSGRSRPVRRLEQYTPDLTWMQSAVRSASGGAIKIGPASNFMQKFPDCEIELISLHGECREATVWFGELCDGEQFRATVLPAGETICGDPLAAWADSAAEPSRYLLDPNPAVVRSGLIDSVCERLALQRLDSEEEYLTSEEVPQSDFVTAFEMEALLPNNQKQLRQYLRDSPGRYYEIKCRHVPIDAASVARKLPAGGVDSKVIFFLRIQGRTRIAVTRRQSLKTT